MKSITGVTIELRLQTMFFFIFITVALVPVMFLAVWIQERTFKQEMDSVHERHLLLARNLTGSLSRYAMDVEAVFKDISTHLESNPPATHQELFETMGVSLITLVTPSGEILKIHYGKEDLLPAMDLSQFLQLESWHTFNRIKISSVTQNRRGNPSIFLSCLSSNGNFFLGNLSTD